MRDAFEEKRERDTKKKKRENRKEDDAGTKEKKIQISLSRGGLSSFALDDTEYTRDTFILFRVVIICLEEEDDVVFLMR